MLVVIMNIMTVMGLIRLLNIMKIIIFMIILFYVILIIVILETKCRTKMENIMMIKTSLFVVSDNFF